MKKIVISLIVCAMVISMSGCASYMSYKASENEIYTQRVMASGDAKAIDALRSGVEPKQAIRAIQEPGMFGVAVDLTALDTIKKHPWRQLGAAILDGFAVYALTEGVDRLNGNGDRQGDGNVRVDVSGDGNNVTVSSERDDNITTDTDTRESNNTY